METVRVLVISGGPEVRPGLEAGLKAKEQGLSQGQGLIVQKGQEPGSGTHSPKEERISRTRKGASSPCGLN